jgi:hypothetical protein
MRIGPIIQQQLRAVDTLCNVLPNCQDLQTKLRDLASEFQERLPTHANVLEKNTDLTLEQQLHAPVHHAVKELESRLKDMGKGGPSTSNGDVTSLVKTTAEQCDVSVSDLNKMFQSSHGNLTPHQYLQFVKQGSVKESQDATLDDYVASSFVIEMYETLKPGLGDKAWVAISKRLRAEGYDSQMVESIVNRAIWRLSQGQ